MKRLRLKELQCRALEGDVDPAQAFEARPVCTIVRTEGRGREPKLFHPPIYFTGPTREAAIENAKRFCAMHYEPPIEEAP
jgi:hypothetical protein